MSNPPVHGLLNLGGGRRGGGGGGGGADGTSSFQSWWSFPGLGVALGNCVTIVLIVLNSPITVLKILIWRQ